MGLWQHQRVNPAVGAPQALQSAATLQATLHPPPLLLPPLLLLLLPPLLLLLLLPPLLLLLLLLLLLPLPLLLLLLPPSSPADGIVPESGQKPVVIASPAVHAARVPTLNTQTLSALSAVNFIMALPHPRAGPRKPSPLAPVCS
jgi:hypothetical protein